MISVIFKKTERGEADSYYMSALIYILSCLFFLFSFHMLDANLLETWGARDTPYLEEHRFLAAKIWRCLFHMSSSIIFWWLPAMWLFATFLFQFGLKPDVARTINKVYCKVLFTVVLVTVIIFYTLLIGPES